MLKHYVEFLYPGIFTSESSSKQVEKRDSNLIEIPEGSFGFRFYDIEEFTTESGKILKGEIENYSGWYYKGQKMSLEDVKIQMPEKEILISNMEINGWDYIVFTKYGQAFPLNINDSVIKEELSND